MNKQSINFIQQHWKLLFHPCAADFKPLLERTVLGSLAHILQALEGHEWLTVKELAEATELKVNGIAQITTALNGQLFEKFQCPEKGRGREVAVRRIANPPLKKVD